jgi:serine/threonine protein kinase
LNESNFDTLRSFFDKGEKVKWTEMRVLGTGSYGKVVEAITSTGNIVAVKHTVIPPAEDDEEQQRNAAADVEELVEEIRLMKALRHRNVVQYYGCQTSMQEDGSRIIDIFLEVCHGGSLNTLRKKLDKATGRMPVYLARSYTRQVLEGLAYLHAKQVAHRDIKGDNVLISAEGFAKLADFGCSKKLGTARILETGKFNAPSDGGALCQTLVGTPLFMAPEVLSESGTGYDTSADIWSVGCLVIELFGQKPWKLQGTTLFSIMYAVAQAKTLPTGMPTECDPKMRSFLEACFDRNPATRATAQQLLSHEWITCKEDTLTEPQWA